MTDKEIKKLKLAIRQLVRAEIADSWKGVMDPKNAFGVEINVYVARLRVARIIESLR